MQRNRFRKTMPRAVIVPAAFALGVGLTAAALRVYAGEQKPPLTPPAQALALQSAFEQVADRLNPSIVYIKSRQAKAEAGADETSPFNFQFPGVPRTPNFRRMPQMPRRSVASGSGVIVRSDGYILTNDHVVMGADRVTVELADGHEYIGKVTRDFKSDLALIKIDATGLPAAELADSDQIKVGQWAIAFGAPFGQELRNSMTVGIVSAMHRSQTIGQGGEQRYYSSLLQTDASINPGNSGGPLVDLYGRVVGINVAIESPTGANAGIGFAIPGNTARYVMEQLIAKGAVTRGFLGLAPRSLSYAEQKTYGVENGALVSEVQDATPAYKAGFQVEDVITRFNGQKVEGEPELRDMISRVAPGTSVPVVVIRDGKQQTLNVTLGAPKEPQVAAKPEPTKTAEKSRLGISVGNVTDPDLSDQATKQGAKSGAVVVDVAPGSAAEDAGLKHGDVITRLDGKTISNADQLKSVVQGLREGATITAVVRRGDQTILAQIELD